jgi:negative regulator of sigma-B (phosphoserine phosphatase)
MRLVVEHISAPKEGETANGDAVVVREERDIRLIAVIDALGHGPKAQAVADAAGELLRNVSMAQGVEMIMRHLHEGLHGTRGVAAMVCLLTPPARASGLCQLEGCSVGNVDMRFKLSNMPMMLSPGVLGSRLERVKVFSGQLFDAERLAIFSDGIAPRFRLRDLSSASPIEACRNIFEHHRRTHDDATILVADLVN